jgi:hypothetical protein
VANKILGATTKTVNAISRASASMVMATRRKSIYAKGGVVVSDKESSDDLYYNYSFSVQKIIETIDDVDYYSVRIGYGGFFSGRNYYAFGSEGGGYIDGESFSFLLTDDPFYIKAFVDYDEVTEEYSISLGKDDNRYDTYIDYGVAVCYIIPETFSVDAYWVGPGSYSAQPYNGIEFGSMFSFLTNDIIKDPFS